MSEARPKMAFADADGQVYEHPELEMIGWDGECWRPLEPEEIIPLPDGSDLFTLPGRLPAGFDPVSKEVVVVDDGSSDSTADVVSALYDPSVRLVQHSCNRGYGAALRSGFEAATMDLVFFTDADLQFEQLQRGDQD